MTPETQTETPPSVVAGLQQREDTARQIGVCERTVHRWEQQGLPVIKIGKLRLHDPVAVREWLLRQQVRDTPPRGRGRPRNAA